ncbi:MAG: tRNA (N6-isopentenyl adenosine(37)-C2)-methylthiotransferase MiaB [Proteobacteria bacterium]|nr:tRNA (N6-isopentenyl adenosine(37)-C2)-methylthiotransferase MiaB [Pseudomonadota bacterium]
MGKALYIKTYGCQMNVYDSGRIADTLAPLGYTLTDQLQSADMVVLNTCHIREKAAEKLYSELGRLRALKQAGDLHIVVAGCVAQAEGEEIIRRAPWVDVVVGPQSYHTLPQLITRIDPNSRNAVINTDFPVEEKFDYLPTPQHPRGAAAFLTIQEGCDKFCTFCVVPYTRGAEFSRGASDILAEAKALLANGAVEITLLGQNVNAWHGKNPTENGTWSFGRLLFALAELDGLRRLRYTTSHPLDMHPDLYQAHAEIPQLMPYVHLPVQSGSNRILSAMMRRHSRHAYLRIIDRLREARPDMAISGDFIVGFPGETDADFADTLRLVAEVKYASAYSFKYSPRPGTPAANAKDQVPEAVKKERLASLQQLLSAQQQAFNQEKLGQVLEVLVEGDGRHRGQVVGRSPWMQAVHFAGDSSRIGDMVEVKISAIHKYSLAGERVTRYAA